MKELWWLIWVQEHCFVLLVGGFEANWCCLNTPSDKNWLPPKFLLNMTGVVFNCKIGNFI